MKYYYLAIITWISSCNNHTTSEVKHNRDTTVYITTDTVPDVRKVVNKKAVASYLVPVNDPKLDRTFGIAVYETASTFEYVMRMHYEAMEETDTIKIPNFGIWPEIKIIKGPEKISCIVGFLDKKKVFKPYKMVTAKGNQMKLVILKKYYTGRYKTPG